MCITLCLTLQSSSSLLFSSERKLLKVNYQFYLIIRAVRERSMTENARTYKCRCWWIDHIKCGIRTQSLTNTHAHTTKRPIECKEFKNKKTDGIRNTRKSCAWNVTRTISPSGWINIINIYVRVNYDLPVGMNITAHNRWEMTRIQNPLKTKVEFVIYCLRNAAISLQTRHRWSTSSFGREIFWIVILIEILRD